MARRIIQVPLVPDIMKKIDRILTTSGLTRRCTIHGDTVEAYAEMGIKRFFIKFDEQVDDQAVLIFDAANKQALDIIVNLVQTGIEDLNIDIQQQKRQIIENIEEQKCLLCQGPLKVLGNQNLGNGLKVKVMVCQDCHRLEFFKEEQQNGSNRD